MKKPPTSAVSKPTLEDLEALPKSYHITILFKPPYGDLSFDAKSQFMGERYFEVQELNGVWHWIPCTDIHLITFSPEFDELIEFRKRVMAAEQANKEPNEKPVQA
jgi:hypothetical protein